MKNKNINKIILLILLIILIAGISIISTIGLNMDLRYSKSNNVLIYINKEFDVKDIKEITKEVLGNQDVIIQKVEVYEDSVLITARQITEEQRDNLVNKINEKYGSEVKTEDIKINIISNIRDRDLIKPYLIPLAIASVIIIIYLIAKYHKLGILRVILKTIGIILLSQAELISIIAITRIPVGRVTIPMILMIYMLSLVGITTRFEKNLKLQKEEELKNVKEIK